MLGVDANRGVEGADQEHAEGHCSCAPERGGTATPFIGEEGSRQSGDEYDDAGDARSKKRTLCA